MRPFAQLLDRLLYTPQRSTKIALILDYLRTAPDPDTMLRLMQTSTDRLLGRAGARVLVANLIYQGGGLN